MASIDGVLFDYGRTLVTFAYPTEDLLGVLREFRARIETELGMPAPEAETIVHDVLEPLEDYVANSSEDEVEYENVYRDTWHSAGIPLSDELLHDILDAQQQVWDRSVRVDPDAPGVLEWLREHGIKRGICSNAPFPPAMMRRQLTANGIAAMVDAVVFSSEVGKRKPSQVLYRAGLDALGTAAERTLFVGDRVREDYDGPTAAGMRAVIVTAHAEQRPSDGIPSIATLAELPSLLQ